MCPASGCESTADCITAAEWGTPTGFTFAGKLRKRDIRISVTLDFAPKAENEPNFAVAVGRCD